MAKDRVLHLPLFGASRAVSVPAPTGPVGLTALLPAARRMTQAIMSAAVESEKKEGRGVTCKAGCAACCRHLVPITVVEAKSLGAALARLPTARREAVKRRFASALSKMESAGLAASSTTEPRSALLASKGASNAWEDVSSRYQELAIPCPFLENERCVAYEDRPFVCREHMVTTDPRACTTGDGARAVVRPMYMTPALAAVARILDGASPSILPLPFMLEWLEAKGGELASDHDGAEALDLLVDALEPSGEA